MRQFQPTVRQLPSLGRRYDPAAIALEQLDAPAREASRGSDLKSSVPSVPRRRRWLTARATPSS